MPCIIVATQQLFAQCAPRGRISRSDTASYGALVVINNSFLCSGVCLNVDARRFGIVQSATIVNLIDDSKVYEFISTLR